MLRGLDIHAIMFVVSDSDKPDNFYNFLFALLHNKPPSGKNSNTMLMKVFAPI